MGSDYILLLVLFFIILGQSCVLLWIMFKMRRKIHNLSYELQQLKNEAQNSKDGTNRLRSEIQQLSNATEAVKLSLANLESRLNESDRKNEENRNTLKMLVISDLGSDIDSLEKKDMLDEKLRVLLSRVKENISKTENL